MAVNSVIPGIREAASGLPTTQVSRRWRRFLEPSGSAIRSVSDAQNVADVHLGRWRREKRSTSTPR